MPAPEKILDIAVNSMRMGFDAALRAESRGLTSLMATKEAKAAITTFFFGMQAIKAGKVRPAGERLAGQDVGGAWRRHDGLWHCLGTCQQGPAHGAERHRVGECREGQVLHRATGGQGHQARQHDAGSEGRPCSA